MEASEVSRGGLALAVFDPEGTSGIPLYSGPVRSAVVEAIQSRQIHADAIAAGQYSALGIFVNKSLHEVRGTTVTIYKPSHDVASRDV